VLLGLRQVLISAGLSPAARLLLLVPVGALAYTTACLARAPEVTSELARVLRRRPSATISHVEPLAPRLSED
jgi:hypothetical protein